MESSDIVIVGGGIVGLATAWELTKQHPKQTVVVVEKESVVAAHQTGHNSGVLHSGIYYKPGSLKATNCRAGKAAMERFCAEQGVPYKICGKVIVAIREDELDRLQDLYERGQANGVKCKLLDKSHLNELEPHCAGIRAIQVKETGIVDYRAVCERLRANLTTAGQRVVTRCKVTGIKESAHEVIVETAQGERGAKRLVNCAGLYSDQVATLGGSQTKTRIVPFRGEYFSVTKAAAHLCRALIYPVPDPRFPFLGVHFTRMISGALECGPNAVLAFAREGYTKTTVNVPELLATLAFPGFLKMSARYWAMGVGEMWRSFSKGAFVKALQRLIPEIRSEDLEPAPAGVRAQAVAADGSLLDDFTFCETARIVNVINAPSPAATAAFSIGARIAEELNKKF